MTRDVIQNYFSHLEKWVIVPLGCIYNFDETNVMDDSSKKQLSAEKGWKRVKRKVINHSKISISDMFWGNAAGEFIPPMWFRIRTLMKITQQEAITTWCITVQQMGGLTRTHLKHGFSKNLSQASGNIQEHK